MTTSDSAHPADILGRRLRDVRISVIDQCNFRCAYCMPAEVFGPGYPFLKKSQWLTFKEITKLSAAFSDLGVKKLRLTGGEPLLRPQLPKLVEMLHQETTCEEIALTTNGSRLSRHAAALKNAGLNRVTVSMDAIDPGIFATMSGNDAEITPVIEGIEEALSAGLPLKLNAVIRKGTNENQIVPLAHFARSHGITLRFIEFMDVGNHNSWCRDEVFTASEILATLEDEFGSLPGGTRDEGATSLRYQFPDQKEGSGEIGIVASVTKPFCGDCQRARLSAEGKLFTCLFASTGHDLKAIVQDPSNDEQSIREHLANIWKVRSDRYSELRSTSPPERSKVEMSYIGG